MDNKLVLEKTKVLLIMPPYYRLKGLFAKTFSLGLGYIGAVLEKQGYGVKIFSADNNRPDETEKYYNYSNVGEWQCDLLRHQRFVNLLGIFTILKLYLWLQLYFRLRGYMHFICPICKSETFNLNTREAKLSPL